MFHITGTHQKRDNMRITLSSIGILALLIGYSQATPANHDSATAPFSRRNAGQKLAEPLEVILGSKRETGMGLEVVDAQDSTTRSGLTTTSTWDYPGERFGGDKDDDYQVFGKVRFSKVPDKPQEMRLRAIEPEHGFSDSDVSNCYVLSCRPGCTVHSLTRYPVLDHVR